MTIFKFLIPILMVFGGGHQALANAFLGNDTAYIKVNRRVNLRSSSNFQGSRNRIRTLQPGEILTVMGRTEAGHYEVETAAGEEGYVFNGQGFFKPFNNIGAYVPRQQRQYQTPAITPPLRPQSRPGDLNTQRVTNKTPRTEPEKPLTALVGQTGLLMPMCGCTHSRCRGTSGFGYRRDPKTGRRKMHVGLDIGCPPGQPIYAASSGRVKKTKRSRWGWGNRVVLSHTGGLTDNKGRIVTRTGYETQYNHLTKISVKHNQWVNRGQQIGTCGSTGRSTGPHLDFNVRANGKYQDPMKFFQTGMVTFSAARRNTTRACSEDRNSPAAAGSVAGV